MNVKIISFTEDSFLTMWRAYVVGNTDWKAEEIHAPLSKEKLQAFETLRLMLDERKAMDKVKIIKRFREQIEKGNDKIFEFCNIVFSVEDIKKEVISNIDIRNAKIIFNNVDTETINLILSCDLKALRDFYFNESFKGNILKELSEKMMMLVKKYFDTYENDNYYSFVDYKMEGGK